MKHILIKRIPKDGSEPVRVFAPVDKLLAHGYKEPVHKKPRKKSRLEMLENEKGLKESKSKPLPNTSIYLSM